MSPRLIRKGHIYNIESMSRDIPVVHRDLSGDAGSSIRSDDNKNHILSSTIYKATSLDNLYNNITSFYITSFTEIVTTISHIYIEEIQFAY